MAEHPKGMDNMRWPGVGCSRWPRTLLEASGGGGVASYVRERATGLSRRAPVSHHRNRTSLAEDFAVLVADANSVAKREVNLLTSITTRVRMGRWLDWSRGPRSWVGLVGMVAREI
jgi:hypothetical protein